MSLVEGEMDMADGYTYLLVVEGDLRQYLCLAPRKFSKAKSATGEVLRWCVTFGTP